MPEIPENFLGLEPPLDAYETARAAILPVLFERTTSYRKGTHDGPEAILRASRQVETYDDELDTEAAEAGIATVALFAPEAYELEAAIGEIRAEAHCHLEAGKFLVTLGGEHSLTLGPVLAAREVFGEIGVVQFDAHADLRASYEGTPYSHASVMRRIFEAGVPAFGIGIRALSSPEAELIREHELPILWGRELDDPAADERFEQGLASLPERVYLTFDVDYFDPSIVPATGTPEPGGGRWYPTLRWLRRLFEAKDVVAMDAVELAPLADQPASDLTTARLIYKCLGYKCLGYKLLS